jgi:two-component system, NarL family, sensor kinase
LKTARRKRSSLPALACENAELQARLAEAEETLRAIRAGEVDAVMTAAKKGAQVFTLNGAEQAYRMLIESMNEGALTLTTDKLILYANQNFARMVKCPLKRVMGSSFRRFLSAADRATLQPLMKAANRSGSKLQLMLRAVDGSQMPVQVSIRPTAKNGIGPAVIGMVVTDLTEARRNEQFLRTLTQRTVQAQEDERMHVGLELHDNIIQRLCAILIRLQALAIQLPAHETATRGEARKLIKLLGRAAAEVQRISRNLRSSVLENLGLASAIRAASAAFVKRTGVPLRLNCAQLAAQLPASSELALYRILEEALRNVEKHARARQVTVHLAKQGDVAQLTIKDDGIGFARDHRTEGLKRTGGIGLLSMSERAAYLGGAFEVRSARRTGTEVEVRIPLPQKATAAK